MAMLKLFITIMNNLETKIQKKLSKTDLILQKLNKIQSNASKLKQDIKILKRENTKNGRDLNPNNKNN